MPSGLFRFSLTPLSAVQTHNYRFSKICFSIRVTLKQCSGYMTSLRRHVPGGKMLKHGDSASEHYSVCFVFQTELVKALMSLAIFSFSHNGVRRMLRSSPFGQWVKRRLAKLVVRQAGCGNLYRSMTFRQKMLFVECDPMLLP